MDQIIKKVQIQGSGESPKSKQLVRFKSIGKIKETQQVIFERKHFQRAIIGNNQLNSVIQKLLITMKQGQKTTFSLSKQLSQDLLKASDKHIDLTLQLIEIGCITQQNKYLTFEQKQKKANSLKLQGNELIKDKKWSQCIQKYLQAYKLIEYDTTAEIQILKTSLLLNLSLVYINNKQFQQSLQYCQKVLREDPLNLKGLYRKALVLKHLGQFDRAINQIKKVLDDNPENKQFESLLKQIKQHQEQNIKNQKKMFSKMFGGA